MEISTSKDPPCKTCLKYTLCNSYLRSELSDYRNPSDVHTISVVSINALILQCKDFEAFIDDLLDNMFPESNPPSGHLDVLIHTVITKTFNVKGIKGYPYALQ